MIINNIITGLVIKQHPEQALIAVSQLFNDGLKTSHFQFESIESLRWKLNSFLPYYQSFLKRPKSELEDLNNIPDYPFCGVLERTQQPRAFLDITQIFDKVSYQRLLSKLKTQVSSCLKTKKELSISYPILLFNIH